MNINKGDVFEDVETNTIMTVTFASDSLIEITEELGCSGPISRERLESDSCNRIHEA